MKKLYAVLGGFLLFGILTFGFDRFLDIQIINNSEIIRNHRTKERFWSSETQKLIMDENTLVIFGSSELASLEDYEENISNFLNAPDMNVITMGAGYYQSLSHTMELGAIADEIPNKKVALFLSPQWFQSPGITQEAFPARFGEETLLGFLANDKISNTNKEYVLERICYLLSNSPVQYSRVIKYKNSFTNKISIDRIYVDILHQYWKLQGKYSVFKQLDNMDYEIPKVDLEHMDFKEMLLLAQKQGEASCTNNDFGIYDEYWDIYVKEIYEKGKIKEKTEIFTESAEYDDLKCFFDTARELGVKVILVSIPVNGKWYAFQGMFCDEYYEKIRDMAKEYDNVILADMTKYEDEKYFLRDVMHLGWKGWARISEVLYHEFKKE